MLLTALLGFIFLVSPVLAQEKGWEKEWREILRRAKEEGKVVVHGPADPLVRRELPQKFTARFGIPMEYLAGNSRELAVKLMVESRAGVHTIDAFMSGAGTYATLLHPAKMLDPLRPLLVLPDVLDPSKWKKGELWFMDPEGKYVLRLFNYLSGNLYINTREVRPTDLASVKNLLNPRWKGKISVVDPAAGGQGAFHAAIFLRHLGEEFVKKLYIDQAPAVSRDTRLLTDWLARGTYPISLGAGSEDVKRLRQEGFPVAEAVLPDMPIRAIAGNGCIAVMRKAPHRNAARLFINWIASKEGLEVYSRAHSKPTTRNDIDESFLAPEEIPPRGVEYFDGSDWFFTSVETPRARARMVELLRK